MSYILEALRKVEQQREHLPAHGLSSRRRYYSAMDGHNLPRAWLLAIAAVAGASLSGGVAAYLVADNRKEAAPPPQPQLQAQRPAAARSSPPPVSTPRQRPTPPVTARPAQAKAPAVPPALPSPPPAQAGVRMPGPRQVQAKPSPQPQQKRTIAQEQPPREAKPVETPATTPKPEAPPEPKQPVPPTRQQETELASARPAASGVGTAPLVPKAAQPVDPATASDPLDMIAPPKAVEVQPFRPNDVLRPPASRKRAASESEPPLLSTLSSQFQSMVPKMTINAQVYSAVPRQRFVVINMKRYNEGQSTAEGVNVETIRQQDIILAYQGQRFRVGR